MFRRVGRVIMNNFGLKVLAAVLAIILWLAVVNLADTNQSVTFTIPVTIQDADYLAKQGKTYEILDNTYEITFTVEGPRSIVSTMEEGDFSATADLARISADMTVPIDLKALRHSGQLEITSLQSDLVLQVEDLVTKEFDIEVVTDGTPAADCYVESAQAKPSSVSVTGAESVVDQIDSAQLSVSVDGAEEDFTTEGPIVLVDEKGAEVEVDLSSGETVVLLDENGENMEAEDHLTMNVDEAEASVKIFMTKAVPLRFVVIGDPAEGYWSAPAECDVDSIVIEGDVSTIRDIDEIVIDSARLDVAGAEQDVTVQITLSNYLPDGVTLAEGVSDSITVTLPIAETYTTEVEMPTSNLTAANLADDLAWTTPEESIRVRIVGPEAVVGAVNGNRLEGTIDASGCDEGSYDLPVNVDTEGAYDAEATVTVNITKTAE